MTDRIDELQRLHEEAHPAPWFSGVDYCNEAQAQPCGQDGCVHSAEGAEILHTEHDGYTQDAWLAIAARNALPSLLRVARAAKACLNGSEVDGWHTPMREVDVMELRASLDDLAELRGTP